MTRKTEIRSIAVIGIGESEPRKDLEGLASAIKEMQDKYGTLRLGNGRRYHVVLYQDQKGRECLIINQKIYRTSRKGSYLLEKDK